MIRMAPFFDSRCRNRFSDTSSGDT